MKKAKPNRVVRIPVQCDQCYVRGELVERPRGYEEHWPAAAPNCRCPPFERCPNLEMSFSRTAHGRRTFAGNKKTTALRPDYR